MAEEKLNDNTRAAGIHFEDHGMSSILDDHSNVLMERSNDEEEHNVSWVEREHRNALKHVSGLSTELQDVTEVEYRKIRLERVVLVGVWSRLESTLDEAQESLRELAALAETAGAVVLDGVLQQRAKPDSATYIGSGKARECANIVASLQADTVIVDADLPPSQRRALEDIMKVKVVDRTAVILDIFAQHATSREGKAQVELAQLQYMLPRLRGWGASLSRQAGGQAAGQAGGIGSRGPGETKIEMDRRRIRNRIAKLKADIAQMEPGRAIKRQSRQREGIPTIAVVGYTNAGKSSLTNRLTGATEVVENALFATLDTAVRSACTEQGRMYAYVDTVGFVRSLPTQLVEAFKSTLEEVSSSSVILHVVDASYKNVQQQIDTVTTIIGELDHVVEIPQVLAFNKIDCLNEHEIQRLHQLYPEAYCVSALHGEGLEKLSQALEDRLPFPNVRIEGVLPYTEGSLLAKIRQLGIIHYLEHQYDGVHLVAQVDETLAHEFLKVAQ